MKDKKQKIASNDEETKIVRVHSGAIHIENKSRLVQRKAWFELVYKALPSMTSKNEFSVSLKDLKEAIGWDKSKNDEELKEMLHQLTSTAIQWNILEKDKTEVWESNALLAGCKIVKGSGICNYAFSPFLQRKLLNPEMYAKIDLIVSHKFKSKHAMAIYCLALDYLNISQNYGEKNLTIQELRTYFGLKENEYKLTGDLNRWIIKPSEQEINEISDMNISITPIIQKKRTTGFKFIMSLHENRINIYKSKKYLDKDILLSEQLSHEEHQKTAKKELISVHNENLKKFFANHHISITTEKIQSKLREIQEIFGQDKLELYLSFLVTYAEKESEKGIVKNFAGFFVNLLTDDTQFDNYLFSLEKEKEKEEQRKKKLENMLETELKNKYDNFVNEDFKVYLQDNIDNLEQKFIALIQDTLKPGCFEYDIAIAKMNSGKIDKSLIIGTRQSVKSTILNHTAKYKDKFGYKPISFKEWKSKTLNGEYLNNLRKELEEKL